MRSIDGFVWVLSFRFPALGTEYIFLFFGLPLITFGQMYSVKLPQAWFYDGREIIFVFLLSLHHKFSEFVVVECNFKLLVLQERKGFLVPLNSHTSHHGITMRIKKKTTSPLI